MCGVAGMFGASWERSRLEAMVASQRHRGPDASGTWVGAEGRVGLGGNRLSIVDLSPEVPQPMPSADGSLWIAFNGEIYNHVELRRELADYPYATRTDTEVVLAAYERWGERCLDRLVGMFAFLLWDESRRRLLAVRDRFGVKPLYYGHAGETLVVASEIKALHAAGVPGRPDEVTWATYLGRGAHDESERTFWEGVRSVPAGGVLEWREDGLSHRRWYDLAERVGQELDERPIQAVEDEYLDLLTQSVGLRFRSDVAVGVNLSGGLDSAILLELVQRTQGDTSAVAAFTFTTGDPRYDELPWVQRMLAHTHHPSVVSQLEARDVPALAASVQAHEDEPFGGLPTLAYAKLFERARASGAKVVLDGNGMDEQWAGYDYYATAGDHRVAPLVQGAGAHTLRPGCLDSAFLEAARPFDPPAPFGDPLRDLQYRDLCQTKIPRVLRYNDRISMRASVELREPFLDHRLVELALRQPAERKINAGTQKWLLRRIGARMVPGAVAGAPKRPVQTPQREWLAGPLADWAEQRIESAIGGFGSGWLDPVAVRREWRSYREEGAENSFFAWQWISLGLMSEAHEGASAHRAEALSVSSGR